MSVRFAVIAAVTMIGAGPTFAEPPKAQAHAQSQPMQSRPVQVVLASADEAANSSPDANQPVSPPAKRPRVARVTTCRCGDEQDPQEQ